MSTILAFLILVLSILLGVFFYAEQQSADGIAKLLNTEKFDLPEQVANLPVHIKQWSQRGSFRMIFGFNVFVIDIPQSSNANAQLSPSSTSEGNENESVVSYVLIHGFPTSSLDYQSVIDPLSKKGRVITWDHVGFGLSEKPQGGRDVASTKFTYSIFEHADIAIRLLLDLEVKNIVLVSHDMGDSVLTEIITRRDRGILPQVLSSQISRVVFTNGGMQVHLSNWRISQILLRSSVGYYVTLLFRIIDPWMVIARLQLQSIFSPSVVTTKPDTVKSIIDDILALNAHKRGDWIMHKTIRYLQDRVDFEYKWIASLSRLDIPCMLLWGQDDAVAPIEIARTLHNKARNCKLIELPRTGHFVSLENPDSWLQYVLAS